MPESTAHQNKAQHRHQHSTGTLCTTSSFSPMLTLRNYTDYYNSAAALAAVLTDSNTHDLQLAV